MGEIGGDPMAKAGLLSLLALVAWASGAAVESLEGSGDSPELPIELGRHTIDTAIQDVTALEKQARKQDKQEAEKARNYVALHTPVPVDPLKVAQDTITAEEARIKKKNQERWDSLDKIKLDPLTSALEAVDAVAAQGPDAARQKTNSL